MSKEIDDWKRMHQPYELRFHQGKNYRWWPKYETEWTQTFEGFMGLNRDSFNDGIMLDIGCGSRPCLDWFNGGERYHLDPLLPEFMKIPQVKQYWEDKEPQHLLQQPAEVLYDKLVGKCDFVVCCNVLDHTYSWRDILNNMLLYCKKGGTVCFNTDLTTHGMGHPGVNNHAEFYKFFIDNFEIVKSQPGYLKREAAYSLRKR